MNNFIEKKVEEFREKFSVWIDDYTIRLPDEKLSDFLRQALQEQKELIMSCLPMKATFDCMDTKTLKTRGEVRAFNECRSEFIENVEEKV